MARLTRKAFEAWLSEQPPATKFESCDAVSCPIGEFTGRDALYDSGLPRWAEAFMLKVDSLPGFQVTATQALKLLRSLP